jgi:hypothetical protein
MSDFTPKTRLEKILCGVTATAKTRIEKAVKRAVENAGSGGGGGSGAAVEVETTISIDSETGVVTATVSGVTAGEAYRYALAGRQFAIHADNPPMPGADSVTMVMPMIVFRVEQGGQPLYFIKAYCDANEDDKLFYSDYLVENDPVVLHTAKET